MAVEFPVARKIDLGKNDAGTAAVFDRPESADVGRVGSHELIDTPDRMLRAGEAELIFSFRKNLVQERLHAIFKAAAIGATGLGEDEAAAIDVVSELLFKPFEFGGLAATDEQDRRLQQVFHRRRLRIDDLPSEIEPPLSFDERGEIGDGARVTIPIFVRAMLHLCHEHGSTAFGQEQKSQRCSNVGIVLGVSFAEPFVAEGVLAADEILGAGAVPIMVADEAAGREPPHAFQSV